MNSKAIARIVPVNGNEHKEFYAATLNESSNVWCGVKVDGKPYRCFKPYWKVEMLPVEWDGEGLPPVGTVCERSFNGTEWFLTTIVAHVTPSSKEHQAAFCDNDGDYNGWGYASAFRPIRSARDKAVDKIKELLMYDYGDDPRVNDAIFIYDAIAAGKIPGVKLAD